MWCLYRLSLVIGIPFVGWFKNRSASVKIAVLLQLLLYALNKLLHSIWLCSSSEYQMKSNQLGRCCSCPSVLILRVYGCTQYHNSSLIFPQSYQCLFSYCENLISPAFFACPSLTKIYGCVYPINTSSHYVNWPQSIAVIILTGSPSLSSICVLLFCLCAELCPPDWSHFDPLQSVCPAHLCFLCKCAH